MTENKEAEKLSKKIVEEKERHEKYLDKEEKRHNHRVRTIKQESGLKNLITKTNRVDTIAKERRKLRDKIEDKIFPVIAEMSTRKKETFPQKLTIRDGKIYKYNKSKKPNLGAFYDRRKEIKEEVIPEEKHGQYDSIIKQLDRLNLNTEKAFTSGIRSKANELQIVTKIPEDKLSIDEDVIMCYQSSHANRMQKHTKSQYEKEKEGWGSIWGGYSSGIKINSNDKQDLSQLVKYMPYFKPLVDDVLEQLRDSIETRREVHEQIIEITSEYHFIEAL